MNIFKKIFGNSQSNIKEETKMTNTQKALELINTFANGDTEKAASLLAEGTSSTISPTVLVVMPLSAR